MMPAVRLRFSSLAPVLLLLASCASRQPAVYMPPRLDLARYGAIGISSLNPDTLPPLIQHLEERLAALVPLDGSSQKSAAPILTLASRP